MLWIKWQLVCPMLIDLHRHFHQSVVNILFDLNQNNTLIVIRLSTFTVYIRPSEPHWDYPNKYSIYHI